MSGSTTDTFIDVATSPAWLASVCARYTLTPEQAKLVIAGVVHIFAFAPRYNIGPAQRVPVLMETPDGIQAVEMRWGIPSEWPKTLHICAQTERIHQTTNLSTIAQPPLPRAREIIST